MIEKVMGGYVLDGGKVYHGTIESGMCFHFRDIQTEETYLLSFSSECPGGDNDIPLYEGQFVYVKGFLRHTELMYRDLYVLEVSFPVWLNENDEVEAY